MKAVTALVVGLALTFTACRPEPPPNVCVKSHWTTYVSQGRMGRDQKFPMQVCDEWIRAEDLGQMRGWKWAR